MGAELGMTAGRVSSRATTPEWRRDRRFFTGMAIALLLTVFLGFAPSYYLGSYFGARPLSGLVHLHGVLATSWILLFLTQTSLIAGRRIPLHRRLGVVTAVVGVFLVVVGYLTAVEAARRGVTPPGGPPPMAFLSVPLGTLAAFTILASLALYFRRKSDTHKRLMLLATIAMVTPALARLRFLGGVGPPYAIGGTCLFVVACMVYDRAAHGRVHPAFLWGGLALMISLPLRFAIGSTGTWLSIADWLTR